MVSLEIVLLALLLVAVFFIFRLVKKNFKLEAHLRMFEREKKIVLGFSHDIAEVVAVGEDRSRLFDLSLHAMIHCMCASSGCAFSYDDNTKKLTAIAIEGLFPPLKHIDEKKQQKISSRTKFMQQLMRHEEFDLGEGIPGEVALSRRGEVITLAMTDKRIPKHKDPQLEIQSLMAVPLILDKKLFGVIVISSQFVGHHFSKGDFQLAETFAEQTALALHNMDNLKIQVEKNRIDMDLHMASGIQGLLLPSKLPDDYRYEINAFYKPAQRIGGDLYNVVRLDQNRIGIAIADVSGKGISGSLIMAICQTHLKHFMSKYDSPSQVLCAINRELFEEMRNDMFITMVYAIVDLEKERITIARAGHELPLYVFRGENALPNIEKVSSEGMALGMVPCDIFDVVIKDKEIPFTSGDMFMLYTDGVTETVNEDGQEFTNMRLGEYLQKFYEKSVEEINRLVIESVFEFRGKTSDVKKDTLADDATLITLKRL